MTTRFSCEGDLAVGELRSPGQPRAAVPTLLLGRGACSDSVDRVARSRSAQVRL
jgi:hypothetical protein